MEWNGKANGRVNGLKIRFGFGVFAKIIDCRDPKTRPNYVSIHDF
jgi:hypothetical protein